MTTAGASLPFVTAALVVFSASLAAAQPSTRPPTQILLRRLAEAVEGNRQGGDLFVVAREDSVAGVFSLRDAAEDARRRLGPDHQVFGPYRYAPPRLAQELPPPREVPPPRTHDIPEIVGFDGCVHDGDTSEWRAICPENVFSMDSVQAMSLTFRMRNGTVRTISLPASSDAVFLTMPAVDKFVVPYYARVLGLEAASAMRHAILYRADSLRRR